MAIDLSDYVESLRRSINPAGQDLFPDAVDGVLTGYLSDSFWEGKMEGGFYENYTEDAGIVSPISGSTELGREWIALIIFYASVTIISNELRNTNTMFSAQAGPVSYETQNSAQLLRDQLRALIRRKEQLLETLSSTYDISVGYIDAINARTDSLISGFTFFPQSDRVEVL